MNRSALLRLLAAFERRRDVRRIVVREGDPPPQATDRRRNAIEVRRVIVTPGAEHVREQRIQEQQARSRAAYVRESINRSDKEKR